MSFAPNAWRLSLVIVILLLSAGTNRAAQLIMNGGFELPDLMGSAYSIPPIGVEDPSIPDWQVTMGNVEIVSSAFAGAAFEGNQWLDLDGVVPGAVQQTFPTLAGQSYRLTFAFTQNPNVVSASGIVDIVDGLNVLLTDSITGSGSTFGNLNWSPFQQTFVADSSSATLQFSSTDPPFSNSGLALDAVSIETIPEPGTLEIVSTGVFGICFWFALLHHKCTLSVWIITLRLDSHSVSAAPRLQLPPC
jgi:hypothetical protein